jgi:hypothetical protein
MWEYAVTSSLKCLASSSISHHTGLKLYSNSWHCRHWSLSPLQRLWHCSVNSWKLEILCKNKLIIFKYCKLNDNWSHYNIWSALGTYLGIKISIDSLCIFHKTSLLLICIATVNFRGRLDEISDVELFKSVCSTHKHYITIAGVS